MLFRVLGPVRLGSGGTLAMPSRVGLSSPLCCSRQAARSVPDTSLTRSGTRHHRPPAPTPYLSHHVPPVAYPDGATPCTPIGYNPERDCRFVLTTVSTLTATR